ncbi:BMC domain-containing protein [Brevibacillus sp. SYSU BS000544]|uniref:BMC domain-containing protein n=1 Tax=Brevibacillus sp. SYSU BS000544 TaxID=3416443 RepID=UPI003CE521E2
MSGRQLSLGMIETWGYPALIAAADAAAKAADVKVVTYQGADAGIVTIYIVGDVASVKAAVEIGASEANRVGTLLSSHVIPRPDQSISQMLWSQLKEAADKADPETDASEAGGTSERWEQMTVAELRKLARELADFPLSGQEISSSRKEDLIRCLQDWKARRGDGTA